MNEQCSSAITLYFSRRIREKERERERENEGSVIANVTVDSVCT